MDYLPLLYARVTRKGGPCVPFWGLELRRQVAICAVAKEGRADAVGPPRGEVPVDLMGRACVGVAPTGSLFIDMPQFLTSGSLERWAMCPMFAVPTPIVRHRNPRWPGLLTLMCLWARLSIITCLMRLVGGCRPTDLYDLKVHMYGPRDDGQDLPRVCRGACRA